MRPWRAAIANFLGAYILLPSYAFIPLPGLPDYSKYTAAGLGALIGVLLFDLGRVLAFRPRWYDLAMLILCLEPGVSILVNGLPAWEGVTAVSDFVLPWGVPYFIGRLYASQPGAARDLARGWPWPGR